MTEKDQRRNWMGRMEQLRQRMGCGAGKRYFFSGAFAIAEGKKCRHASYAKQTAFHLSHFSSSLLVINKKKNKGAKKKLYISSIFIFFAFLAARYIYTSRDTAERIPGFPEAPNRSPHHRSPSSRRPLLPYRSIRRPRSPFFFVLLLEAGNNPFDTVINRPDRVPFSITSRILYHASLSLLHSSSSWTLEC
jgi:hypothetical protein